MRREYPQAPIMGVGGIIFKDEAVLLAKRAREPGKGQWSIPGGVVELGETLIEALVREVREEVSVEIKIGGLVRLFERIVFDQAHRVRYHYIIADYWALWLSGSPFPATDVSEACFFPLRRLSAIELPKELGETILTAVKMRDGDQTI